MDIITTRTMQHHTQLITLTPNAVQKAKAYAKGGNLVKFGVRKGGCSGYMYDIGITKEVGGEDEVIEQDGVKVIVPSGAKEFLKGSTIDYLDGLMGAGFKISNPNITKSCKCGHSIR